MDFTIENATELEVVCHLDRLTIGDDSRRDYLNEAIQAGNCFLVKSDLIPVGFAVFTLSFYGFGFIELLIIHPDWRRKGAASTLISYLEAICPTEKIFTSTNLSNTPMHHLCKSLGYVGSGYIDNLDENDPEIIYFKRLNGQVRK